MTAPLVCVVDHVPFEAAVSQDQALVYCRRVLVGWTESQVKVQGVLHFTGFSEPSEQDGAGYVSLPMRFEVHYYGEHLARAIDRIVTFGFASYPSEVLRAMSTEVVT